MSERDPLYEHTRHPAAGDWAAKHDVPNPGLAGDASRGRLTPLQSQRARAAYLGLCTHIDYELGRMMEHLAGMGLLGDMLIILTSDHGGLVCLPARRNPVHGELDLLRRTSGVSLRKEGHTQVLQAYPGRYLVS